MLIHVCNGSAALAGLVITSCLSLTGMANWLVRQSGEAEIAMNRQASL